MENHTQVIMSSIFELGLRGNTFVFLCKQQGWVSKYSEEQNKPVLKQTRSNWRCPKGSKPPRKPLSFSISINMY